MTPLMFAALADHYDLVKYFLQCSGGMDVNAVDWQGNSALHYAAAGRCLQAIDTRHKEVTLKALVEKGANVNEANHDGMTPIMNAISDGNEDAVAVLLASHADVNTTTKFGMTPLMHAAAQGSTTVLTLLLNAGACAAVKTHDGNTALHYAASRGRFAAYELLRDKFGCSTSDQNSSGKTPEELFEHAKETKQGDRVSIFSR
ncbi:ankyrin repeat protein, putative [Bodo saltans]|uniref:Ankyrin repeat protein, putative n=1 Tax=Bodo saltans TaxID=75058 RepID=A0A0S4IRX0_BODSA|nr:ankyrin repeat protein, putative [Bodo saltans]|eukprot:CUF56535.1 ankyrin repeat protein, putative [Bodo saltans]